MGMPLNVRCRLVLSILLKDRWGFLLQIVFSDVNLLGHSQNQSLSVEGKIHSKVDKVTIFKTSDWSSSSNC